MIIIILCSLTTCAAFSSGRFGCFNTWEKLIRCDLTWATSRPLPATTKMAIILCGYIAACCQWKG